MKERITVTLEQDVIARLDRTIDGVNIKNRSHAMESLLLYAMGRHYPKKAIILAGGKGTRLRPLTLKTPKALLPIAGKTITEHLFDLFKKYGIRDIIMCVGYMKEKIKDYFGDGSKFDIHITYVEEDEPMGTAGPIKLSKNLLDDTFIVSNGDELKDIDIAKMHRLHVKKSALVTDALTTVADPSAYGVAKLSGSKILEFVEKPKPGKEPSNLINAGFYICEPSIIKYIPDGFAMLETDVFPKLAAEGKLRGFPFSGQWFDTGNMERYEKAKKCWKGLK